MTKTIQARGVAGRLATEAMSTVEGEWPVLRREHWAQLHAELTAGFAAALERVAQQRDRLPRGSAAASGEGKAA